MHLRPESLLWLEAYYGWHSLSFKAKP